MGQHKREEYERFFEKTLTEYHPMIARTISTYERIPALQEELYQEISVALWKAIERFDNQSSLKTYILSIAHKRAISHVARYVKEPLSVEIEESHLNKDGCPSDAISSEQKMTQLMAALYLLSMSDRQLVTLALEGLSYKDISAILGISVTNVGAKLSRAKSKLNKILTTAKKA